MVLSKQLSASPDETLAEKFVFRKKAINFIIVGHWTKNIGFCQNLSGRNLIIALYVSLGKLWGEKNFFVTIILIYHLRTSSELFLSLCWKIVRRGSHNYNLHVHGKILMESSIFFGPLPMFISLLANLYGRVVKNAILVSTEIFWGEVFLWKTSLLPPLSHIDRECFGQLSIFLTVSLKLHSTCVEKSFEQAIMKNLFFFIFLDFELICSRFFSKLCQWFCQNSHLHPKGNVMWKNNFFLQISQFYVIVAHGKKTEWILSKLFWLECQICILPFHWNILRRKVFVGIFFSNYDLWTMNELFFWFLTKIFRTWYSKLQSAYRQEVFEENFLFFSRKTLFFFSLRKKIWREVFIWELIVFAFSW